MVRTTKQEGSNMSQNNNNKSLWTVEEDNILMEYVKSHGKGRWNSIAKRTGLKRCGKSCRLRWMNYLSPNVKRDGFTPEEEDLIVRLHNLLGNRWSLIAKRVPGRTDNQVKNYWNTHLSKKLGLRKKTAPSNDTMSSGSSADASPAASTNLSNNFDSPSIMPTYGDQPSTSEKKDDSGESGTLAAFEDNPCYVPTNFWDFEGDISEFNVMEILGDDSHDLSWLYS